MQTKYAGPTAECENCEREIPKKNTWRVALAEGRNGPMCEVCIMLRNQGTGEKA